MRSTFTQRQVGTIVACGTLIAVLLAELLWLGGGRWRLHHTIGLMIVIPGFVVWATARLQLGSAFTTRAEARTLVTHGVYRCFRHPIYAAGLFVTSGVFVFIGQPALFIVIALLAWHQRKRARREERVLEDAFGDRYREYRARTWP